MTTEAEGPYRAQPKAPSFVCVACFQCSSTTDATCANCGNKMQPLASEEVTEFVCEEARRRVNVIVRRQAIFAAAFALPLFFYLLFLSTVGQTLTFALPLTLFFMLGAAHPYIFKRDARIGRKYRRSPAGVTEALDVLGTRMQ